MERSWDRRNNENRVEGLGRAGILWHHIYHLICSTRGCEVNENVVQESSLVIKKVLAAVKNDLNRD